MQQKKRLDSPIMVVTITNASPPPADSPMYLYSCLHTGPEPQ